MIHLVECLRALERHLGAPMMTGELQIIASLYSLGVMPSQNLQAKTDMSPAGFHIVKRRLLDKNLIVGEKSSEDLRITKYDLTPESKIAIEAILTKNTDCLNCKDTTHKTRAP